MIFQVKQLLKEPNHFQAFPVCHLLIMFCRYKEPSSSNRKKLRIFFVEILINVSVSLWNVDIAIAMSISL